MMKPDNLNLSLFPVSNRPVSALIDIEIEQSDTKKLSKVHHELMVSYGPSNPTLVVRVQNENEGDEDEEVDVSELMELFDEYGNVVMLRLV